MNTESFTANSEIVLRMEDDGAFLFDPDSGRICYVNEAGIAIWKKCKNPASLAQILHHLESEFADVPAEQAAADCREFLCQLDKLGFLVPGVESLNKNSHD
jgi:hypothetical protein